MKLKLIAIYLNETQLEYIITVQSTLLQEKYNFEFEYFDSSSSFVQLHGVKTFPSFYLMKDDRVVSFIEGKLDLTELQNRIMSLTYVKKESN